MPSHANWYSPTRCSSVSLTYTSACCLHASISKDIGSPLLSAIFLLDDDNVERVPLRSGSRCVVGVGLPVPALCQTPVSYHLHRKNIRISTDILWQVFYISTEPFSYEFVMWACAPLFRQFTATNAHGTGSVRIRKTRHKISVYIRIVFTL